MDVQPMPVFDLPERLSAKADPNLVAEDEQHFASIAENLERSIAYVLARLDALHRSPGGVDQAAMERDMEIHRLSARLRHLQRLGLDVCLGHMLDAADGRPVYIGRLGLLDDDGNHLLFDWRTPAAEPFFGGPTPIRWG